MYDASCCASALWSLWSGMKPCQITSTSHQPTFSHLRSWMMRENMKTFVFFSCYNQIIMTFDVSKSPRWKTDLITCSFGSPQILFTCRRLLLVWTHPNFSHFVSTSHLLGAAILILWLPAKIGTEDCSAGVEKYQIASSAWWQHGALCLKSGNNPFVTSM